MIFDEILFQLQLRTFLDLKAIIAEEEEEDYEEDVGESDPLVHLQRTVIYLIGYIVGDDESTSDDEMDNIFPPPLLGPEAQGLENEVRRIAAHAAQSQSSITDDVPLPFRVPHENDPSIWSIRVKVSGSALCWGKH